MLLLNFPRLACRWWCRPRWATPSPGRTASSLSRKAGPRRRRRTRAPRRSTKFLSHSTAVRRWPRQRPLETRSQVLKAGRRLQRRPRQRLPRADRPLDRQGQPGGLVVAAQRHRVTESPMAALAFARVLDCLPRRQQVGGRGLGEFAQPRGLIHRLTDDRVLEALLGA